MASSNSSWGIEIGAAGIKALKVEPGENGATILDAAYIQHPKVLSTPGIDQNDVLRVSLGTLTSQYDLSKAAIAVSVPGHSAFARFAKLPPVEPKKVPAIVKFEAVQQIPFPLEQVEWDYQTFASPDSPEVEVGIFAITRDRIMERLQMLRDVGITPDYVTLSPVAVYNALAYDLQFTEKTPGTIIVDVGTTSTDLIVAEAGRVWIRTFPIGGHQFTEALVNQFKLSYPKAEKLKRESEEGANARHVFQAMRPVFTDLAQDIQRSIGYYQSLHKDANLVRLIGVGATFGLPGLRKYLKQQLSMDVYRMEEFKRLTFTGVGDEKRQNDLKGVTIELATAYGLALQGLGFNTISANLMPVSVIRESMWKSKVKWFGVAAGLAVVAGGGMFIRPLLDSAAVASTSKPPVIQQAISEAQSQRAKADEAKVIGTPEVNHAAANAVALAEAPAYHAYLVDDLSKMLEAANSRAGTWAKDRKKPEVKIENEPAGFSVKLFTTDYRVGAEADTDASGTPVATNIPEDLKAQPRFEVQLQLSTAQPDGLDFALQTIDGWLRANAKRDGIPYQIFPPTGNQIVALLEDAGVAAGGSTPQAGPSSGEGGHRPPDRGGDPRALPTGEGGHRTAPGGQGAPARGDSGDSGSSFTQSGTSSGTSADADRLAPLALLRPKEAAPKRSSFSVRYQVVILPKPAAGAAEGGKP